MSDTRLCSSAASEDLDASTQEVLEAPVQRSGSNEALDVSVSEKMDGGVGVGGAIRHHGPGASGGSSPRIEEALEDREIPQMLRMTIKKGVTFCAAAERQNSPQTAQASSKRGEEVVPDVIPGPAAATSLPASPTPPSTSAQSVHAPSTEPVSPVTRTAPPSMHAAKRSYPLSASAANFSARSSTPQIAPEVPSSGSQNPSARPDQPCLELAGTSHRVRLPELPAIANSLPATSAPHIHAQLAAARPMSALAAAFVGGSSVAANGLARQPQEAVPKVRLRQVQSARRSAVARGDLAERARCIRDDMRHGVTSAAYAVLLPVVTPD